MTSKHTNTNVPRFSWRVKGHDCAIQRFTGTARSAHSRNAFFYVTSGFPTKNAINVLEVINDNIVHKNITFSPFPENVLIVKLWISHQAYFQLFLRIRRAI